MEKQKEDRNLLNLMEQNAELINQNNELLKKIYKMSIVGYVTRIIGYAILIGLPFILYFYFLEPVVEGFASQYELFKEGVGGLPYFNLLELMFP